MVNDKRSFAEATAPFAPTFHIDPLHGERLEAIRQAIMQQRQLQLEYADAESRMSRRVVWPLALYFFGGTWLIAAWCELRRDFRSFQLDRVRTLATAEGYPNQEGRRLADFVRAMQRS